MVCFLTKSDDTAIIRLICGEQSKMNAAVNGGDFMGLDAIINDANRDDNIKHIGIMLNYYDDEDKITSKLKGVQFTQQLQNNTSNTKSAEKKNSKDNNKEKSKDDWTCPECNGNDCLKDKDGNKYPCLSCLQIDIGQKILRQFADKVSGHLKMNNDIIGSFINYLKKENNNDSSSSN